jgi:hypothetical protein
VRRLAPLDPQPTQHLLKFVFEMVSRPAIGRVVLSDVGSCLCCECLLRVLW